ncbi:MAG: glycosyl hydrolase family 28-related protein [Acidobacteriota bacterium]
MNHSSLRAVYLRWLTGLFLCLLLTSPAYSQSVYARRPDDLRAVDARPGVAGLHGDGVSDDADALQAAINRVQETTGEGIVFLAEGRYRLSHTIYLWSGIRLIGYGEHRPTLVLGEHTPGFATGRGFLGTGRYMLQFASRRPIADGPILDANEFTFYSGLSNVDFKIGDGNPAAIAIRFHVAQHSFVAYANIEVGRGRAGLEDVGNQAHDITIHGGDYGIITVRTSPAWQFLLMDAHITGQRIAAIHTEEAGMTLVRVELAETPVGVEISHGKAEQLYGRELLLRHITRSAVVLGDVNQQQHQVTLEEIRCDHVTRLLEGGEAASGWTPIFVPAQYFLERRLTLGQEIGNDGREGSVTLRHREAALRSRPVLPASDIPKLPPVADWVNVKSLHVVGDGVSDDTTAFQQAINTHRAIYLPSGVYRLSGTLHLRRDSVLIGLSSATTILTLKERDPAFMGAGEAVPLLDTPRGGNEIVTGIAVATGDVAPRVAGIIWRGGPRSLIDDVNFPRGRARMRGAMSPASPSSPAGFAQAAKAVVPFRGTQSPSLWIREGGGGVIRNVWTANSMARAGWRVEDTETRGVAYQVSCEHHPKNEVQFIHAAHWSVYALQTEEESPDGTEATAVELDGAHDITFANLFDYRVSRNVLPKIAAVVSRKSSAVQLENMHNFSQTRLAFDNSVIDETSGVAVRTHDFTLFEIGPRLSAGKPLPLPAAFAVHARLEKLAGGFSNATGLTSNIEGDVFFTDSVNHHVYRWDAEGKQADVISQDIEAPQSATFVAPATLLIIDNAKRVFAIPSDGKGKAVKLAPQPQAVDSTLLLPVGLHDDVATLERLVAGTGYNYAPRSNMALAGFNDHEPRTFYYAPGTKVAIEGAGAPTELPGPGPGGAVSSIGTWKPDLQAMQFAPFRVGDSHLVASEDDDKVFRIRLATTSHIGTTIFASRGGTSAVEDVAGNVYVAGAQIYVYDSSGHLSGALEVPERPSSLAFGGPGHRTLFIGARSGLYAIQTAAVGRVP